MWRSLHRLQLFSPPMSSPSSSYRSGRNYPRRSFSDRPYTGGRRGNYVSGDSHFRSVREANLGFRQGESGGSFRNESGFPMPEQPPYPNQNPQFRRRFHQNHQFRPPPRYDYQNQQFRRSPAPPFEHNQARRPPQQYQPRPRPPDFRNWEFAKAAPPSTTERFTILSYNILADYLATEHRGKLYYHIPRYMLDWQWRKRSIIFELGLWSTDVICLQEVDRFQDLEEELKLRGYTGIWKRRTGYPVDGCAIFWRASRFKLLYEESIEFNKLGLRDNVAQICVLELLSQNCDENAAVLQTSSTGSNKAVICNIHVLYNPKRGDIKLGQVRTLLDRAHAVSKVWNDAPIVLCGDYNCVPKSPLYNYISEQKLDLSEVDRDKVSGQASAEIHVQRTYNPISFINSGDNSVGTTLVVQGSEVVNANESSSDMQKPFNLDSSPENGPLVENFSQYHSSSALNACDRSSSSAIHENNEGEVDDEVTEITHQQISLEDPVENFSQSHSSSALNACDRSSSSAIHENDEGEVDDEVTEITQQISLEDPCDGNNSTCNAPGAGNFNDEKLDNSNSGLFGISSKSNSYSEEESRSNGNSLQSLPEVNCSIEVNINTEKTTFSDALDVSSPQNSGDPSSQKISGDEQGGLSGQSQAHLSFASTSIEMQEKLENLSFDVFDGGNIAEDSSTFLSALHNTEEAFSSDSGQFLRSGAVDSDLSKAYASALHDSPQHSSNNVVEDDLSPDLDLERLDVEKNIYDPSLWTPAEIETATGNAERTSLEHPLKLRSVYTEVEDCLGTRDSNGEPLVTSYHRCFLGTVDYIWRSEGLQTVRVLAPIPKHVMQTTPGFPTKKWGSDHIALASELAFVKDNTNHDADV